LHQRWAVIQPQRSKQHQHLPRMLSHQPTIKLHLLLMRPGTTHHRPPQKPISMKQQHQQQQQQQQPNNQKAKLQPRTRRRLNLQSQRSRWKGMQCCGTTTTKKM
jgi:hypothetical protein